MISVCITTYNGEKYIKEQLDSIICQINDDDEIIVSDDGSTDATLNIIAEYNDKRIKVFHHDSSLITTKFPLDKPTHNFEYALTKAHGDIIFLCDQDDVWIEGKVKKMVAALNDSYLAIHDCIVTDSNLVTIAESYFKLIRIHKGVISNIIKASYLGCCMAFRKEILNLALPFPKTKVGHDLWLGVIADAKFNTTLVHEPLIYYRKHDGSMTPSGNKSKYSLYFKIKYRLTIIKEIIKLYLNIR